MRMRRFWRKTSASHSSFMIIRRRLKRSTAKPTRTTPKSRCHGHDGAAHRRNQHGRRKRRKQRLLIERMKEQGLKARRLRVVPGPTPLRHSPTCWLWHGLRAAAYMDARLRQHHRRHTVPKNNTQILPLTFPFCVVFLWVACEVFLFHLLFWHSQTLDDGFHCFHHRRRSTGVKHVFLKIRQFLPNHVCADYACCAFPLITGLVGDEMTFRFLFSVALSRVLVGTRNRFLCGNRRTV